MLERRAQAAASISPVVSNLLTPCTQASGLCHQPNLLDKKETQLSWLRMHDSSVNELL